MLDRKNSIPLHLQVRNFLRNEILKGTFTEKIPAEYDLMDRFAVSRATIRRAIRTLIEEGVLESRQGLGTFVAVRPIEEWLGNLSTFFEIVGEMGMNPNIKVLSQGIVAAPQDAAKIFGMQEVYETIRLRLANDTPVVLETQYYPLDIGRKLAEFDLNNVSTYDILETELGVSLWEAKQTIASIIPTGEEKKLLGLTAEPCCALLSKRLVTDHDGNPLEYEKSIYRGDMYAFRINLTRRRKV
ncbi:GntR family transcriptional regulator [Sporomusa sp.]|uniref:GntR family transcriptional regulator n=1 Tax=Sporomusa sp. TaxID=2078658 RepID=UPI002BF6D873|nr:GntR family transcriptional regulator [Sporomusa sp.]HWR09106.1 GntR family transcriptional regulator [Sporomusa sp.]